MENLQTPSKSDVLKAYRSTDDKGRELLQSLFGNIAPQNVMDRILTFEDACAELGINTHEILPIASSGDLDKDIKSIQAYTKLIIITRALNEGWEPDWDNEDEYKYYPWFYMQDSGFRLDYVVGGCRHSYVGSRLCFHFRA
jgi:hypothetical protein